MSADDGFIAERSKVFETAKALGLEQPNSETLITKLIEAGTTLLDVARLSPVGLRVRVREAAHALQLNIPIPQSKDFKAPATTYLNPTATLQAFFDSQHPNEDPKERELLRLRNESRVRRLSSLEKSTLASLEWQKPDDASAPIPSTITSDPKLSAVQKGEKARQYQQRLKLNRQLIDLRGNEARLRGEGEIKLAGYVKDQIAVCEAKIRASGG